MTPPLGSHFQPALLAFGPALGSILGLFVISRWVAAPLLGGGWLGLVLRSPGNLVHEGAHALGVLLAGYRIQSFSLSVFSPERRGHVRPGRPWAPWGRRWSLYLLAAPAPLPAGVAVLCLLGTWGGPGLQLADWHTWVAALLSLSMAAEMAPSDVDLKAFAGPAAIFASSLALVALLLHLASPSLAQLLLDWTMDLAHQVSSSAISALGQVVLGIILTGVPLLLIRDR